MNRPGPVFHMSALILMLGAFWTAGPSGCSLAPSFPITSATTTPSSTTTTTSTTTSTVAGVRAVKIIFQQFNSGSFDSTLPSGASSSNGTPVTLGSALQAQRIFTPDGKSLATGGPGSAGWPTWLSSFELGLSGSSNPSALNPECARFSITGEDIIDNCKLDSTLSTLAKCGAPVGQYRVSEVDCSLGTENIIPPGDGNASDGIFFRAVFNRDPSALGATENIMAVIEYSASALNPAPPNPASCFAGGVFSPEKCSDFTWNVYLKNKVKGTEEIKPFFLLVPPTFNTITNPGTTNTLNSGVNIATKQIILPLVGTTYNVMQVSRTQSTLSGSATLLNRCTGSSTPGALPGNSPLCAGMIFYSITFYRI